MTNCSPEELSLLKDSFIRDAENLFVSMSGECATCHIPKYRCPECWAHTAKLYLKKVEAIRTIENRLKGLAPAPQPIDNPASRSERLSVLVAILRAAGKAVPACDILIPGCAHAKSRFRLLSIATARGLVRRLRKTDPRTHRPAYYYEPAPPATQPKP